MVLTLFPMEYQEYGEKESIAEKLLIFKGSVCIGKYFIY